VRPAPDFPGRARRPAESSLRRSARGWVRWFRGRSFPWPWRAWRSGAGHDLSQPVSAGFFSFFIFLYAWRRDLAGNMIGHCVADSAGFLLG